MKRMGRRTGACTCASPGASWSWSRFFAHPAALVRERSYLKTFLATAASKSGLETVVFIDTNPTLDIFTEIALMTSNKLVVSVIEPLRECPQEKDQGK